MTKNTVWNICQLFFYIATIFLKMKILVFILTIATGTDELL